MGHSGGITEWNIAFWYGTSGRKWIQAHYTSIGYNMLKCWKSSQGEGSGISCAQPPMQIVCKGSMKGKWVVQWNA